MLDRVLSARIRDYAPANGVEQENVLQELMQHYVLSSLSRAWSADFFLHHLARLNDVFARK